jgi:hypothetical protein
VPPLLPCAPPLPSCALPPPPCTPLLLLSCVLLLLLSCVPLLLQSCVLLLLLPHAPLLQLPRGHRCWLWLLSWSVGSWSVVGMGVGCCGCRLLWLSVVGHGQYTEEGIQTHLLAGVGLPFLLSTCIGQELEHAISNNMHHIQGSKMCLIWGQNTLRRLALARLNMLLLRETLNVISVSITSTVCLCNLRKQRKSGYVGG